MIKFSANSVRLHARRGAILVLAACMLIVIFAFAAFTVDTGYMTIVKTELQATADSCALAAASKLGQGAGSVRDMARELAALNTAAGEPVVLEDSDIEVGVYDLTTKSFTPNEASPNAVRVTARVSNQPTFFAPLIGKKSFSLDATAISMLNPRDIVFVVDLSGSMNDDTEPGWATSVINAQFGPQGFPNVATKLMQDVFSDFGYGSYPGITQYVGSPLGVSPGNNSYASLIADKGPLSLKTIPAQYRIKKGESAAAKK
ncbi:MAG: TadG family pilus assembly protein, partial [Planctomycetaceae bacterium]